MGLIIEMLSYLFNFSSYRQKLLFWGTLTYLTAIPSAVFLPPSGAAVQENVISCWLTQNCALHIRHLRERKEKKKIPHSILESSWDLSNLPYSNLQVRARVTTSKESDSASLPWTTGSRSHHQSGPRPSEQSVRAWEELLEGTKQSMDRRWNILLLLAHQLQASYHELHLKSFTSLDQPQEALPLLIYQRKKEN